MNGKYYQQRYSSLSIRPYSIISFQTGSFVFVFEAAAGLKGESGERRNVKLNACHSRA
jgi:hypothetical protein